MTATLSDLARRGIAAGEAIGQGNEPATRLAAQVATDTLACAAVGRTHPTVRRLLSTGSATAEELERVAVDATAAHVDELDVVHPRSGTVPGAVTVPPALHLGAAADVPAERFLGAVLAGIEVTAAAGLVLGGAQLYARSWWPGAVAGRVGAAMASAYVLGLDPPRTRNALALAASSAGGLLSEDVFADAHYVLLGDAAVSGVQAARRAAAGLRGSETLFDGPLRRAFAGAEPVAAVGPQLLQVMPKEFPCATPLQAVIRALRVLGGAALIEQAQAVEVTLPAPSLAFVSKDRVVDGPPEAAASLAYVLGAVARSRESDVDFFRAADPASLPDCELTIGPGRDDVVEVIVTTADGRRCDHREPLLVSASYDELLGRKVAALVGPASPWLALADEIAAGLGPRELRSRLQPL